jgi:hypothetical protein
MLKRHKRLQQLKSAGQVAPFEGIVPFAGKGRFFFFLISKRGFIKKRKAQSSTHGVYKKGADSEVDPSPKSPTGLK